MTRVVAAVGQVCMSGTEEGVRTAPEPLSSFEPVPVDHADRRWKTLLPEHNPLSMHKMSAAGEIFASAVMRAEAATNRDPAAGRRLVWAWSRQDQELRRSLLRLACQDGGPIVLVLMPELQQGATALH